MPVKKLAQFELRIGALVEESMRTAFQDTKNQVEGLSKSTVKFFDTFDKLKKEDAAKQKQLLHDQEVAARKVQENLNIGGMELNKNLFNMGKQGNISLGGLMQGINSVQSGVISAGGAFASFGIGIAANLGSKAIKLAFDGLKAGIKGTIDLIKDGVKEAADFETAFVQVTKVVDGTRNANGGLTELGEQIKTQVREMAIDYVNIDKKSAADIFTAGGQAGLSGDKLKDFAILSAETSNAFDTDTKSASEKVAALMSLRGMDSSSTRNLLDVMNELSNNQASVADGIFQAYTRVGSTAKSAGFTDADTAAMISSLGAGMEGYDPDRIATAIKNIDLTLSGVGYGGKKSRKQKAVDELGMSKTEIQKMVQKNAGDTLKTILTKISALPKYKRNEVTANLFGKEAVDSVNQWLANPEALEKAREIANSDAAKGSMKLESDSVNNTANARFEQAQDIWADFQMTIGKLFLPYLKDLYDNHMQDMKDSLAKIVPVFKNLADDIFNPGGWAEKLIELMPELIELMGRFVNFFSIFLGYTPDPEFMAKKKEEMETIINQTPAEKVITLVVPQETDETTEDGTQSKKNEKPKFVKNSLYPTKFAAGGYWDQPATISAHTFAEEEPEYMVPQRKLDWALERSADQAAQTSAPTQSGDNLTFIYQGSGGESEARDFARWSFEEWKNQKNRYEREEARASFSVRK
jgi:TP901 family phage tail tape measure protein